MLFNNCFLEVGGTWPLENSWRLNYGPRTYISKFSWLDLLIIQENLGASREFNKYPTKKKAHYSDL